MTLKDLMKYKGMQASNVYLPLQIPRNTWHMYESGRSPLPLNLLLPLSNIFHERVEMIIVASLESQDEYKCKHNPGEVITKTLETRSNDTDSDDVETDE
jgi:hypothetical protein